MLNRRDLFASIASAFSLLGTPFRKQLQSPLCDENIGKPISATIGTQFIFHPQLFESPPSFRFVEFPVENEVTVEYEKGFEVWTTFNMPVEDVASFTMKEFLTSKYEPDKVKAAPGRLRYRGSTFRLKSLSVKDGVTSEESIRIFESM